MFFLLFPVIIGPHEACRFGEDQPEVHRYLLQVRTRSFPDGSGQGCVHGATEEGSREGRRSGHRDGHFLNTIELSFCIYIRIIK